MENPKAFWEHRYSDDAYKYGKEPNKYFQDSLDAILNPGRLLLLAEGEGRNAVYAAQKGWQVTAVDFSSKARDKAIQLASESGVTLDFQVCDVRSFDIEQNGPWDAIGLIYAHFNPGVRSIIHGQCLKALRPGGRLILEAFNRRQLNRRSGGPGSLEMLYSKQKLLNDFAGLDVLEADELTVFLNEGDGHSGLAEVVRLQLERSND
jgi:SAM-dependent methyltransferase